MNKIRRTFLYALVAGVVLWQTPAYAAWPDKPIRLVWPFATGGMGASLARILSEGLSQRLGQAVFVDAKPGGGGIIGFQFVKNAAPDGYMLLVLESFYGLFAPVGTPKEILDRLNRETAAVLASPAVQQQLKTLVIESAPDTSPKYFIGQIKSETARWSPVIQQSGITGD